MSTIGLTSCSKDQEAADRFPRQDMGQANAPFSALKRVELANGITVYLQEEHTDGRVAVEVFYNAGLFQEPEGQPNISHLLEHVCVHSATDSYQPGEALSKLLKHGLVNAESYGTCAHYDYVVPNEELDMALHIEAERLTSVRFHNDVIERESEKAAAEGIEALRDGAALNKYGIMALNQALRYGATSVDLLSGIRNYGKDELSAFHDAHYNPSEMIVVLIGGFQMDEAEALVRKHFESIPAGETTELPTPNIDKDMTVKWDLTATASYLVFPGPYADYKERVALTMFGSFLKVVFDQSRELQTAARSKYSSNQVSPVGVIPFYVYMQPVGTQRMEECKTIMLQLADQAIGTLTERRLTNMKQALVDYVTASMIREDAFHYQVPHHQVIGQEALNVGLKHILKEGRSDEEFSGIVESITLEYLQDTLNKYVSMDNMHEVRLVN